MKFIRAIPAIVVASVALAACGSTHTKTVTVQSSTPKTTATATATGKTDTGSGLGDDNVKAQANAVAQQEAKTTPKPNGPPDCDDGGYTRGSLKQGTCTQGGKVFTVSNNDNALWLKTLHIKLNGIRSANSLSDSSGISSAVAHGRFLILNVTVRNILDSPQTFDQSQDQTALYLGSKAYTENFDAENGADEQSCLWTNGTSGGIQPDESITCDLVYDVSPGALNSIGKDGNFDVLNFGDSVTDDSTHTIGVIRTYHPTMDIGS